MRAQLQKILNDMEPEGLWYHYVVSIYDNLTDIGFDPSSNSFRYALDAILLAHTSQLSIHAIYAAVGHILGVSPQQVKNGIRAVSAATACTTASCRSASLFCVLPGSWLKSWITPPTYWKCRMPRPEVNDGHKHHKPNAKAFAAKRPR